MVELIFRHSPLVQSKTIETDVKSIFSTHRFNTFSNSSSTVDLGVKPMRKNPIFPLLTFRQSTTVEAAFSGDGPSQSTPSH